MFISTTVVDMNAEQAQRMLGQVIRARHMQLGLSQEAFAEKCALHRTYMGSVERGERNISLENILKIAEALVNDAKCL